AKLYLRPRFVICGGEPTLSPLFFPMMRELEGRWPGVRIVVLTNGTRLTPDFVRRLAPYNAGFQISLDGPDADRHDVIRGPGSFAAAMRGLEALQQDGPNAIFQATLSRRTAPWVGDFFQTARRAGIERMNFTRFVAQGNGKRLADGRLDRALAANELRAAYEDILACSARAGVPTNTELPLFRLLGEDLGANGKVGFQGVIIDYRGNLKVTSRADFRLGNILEEGLESLFLRHPLMEALREGDIEGCGKCEHYADCGGDRNASFAATGSFFKKDPACWLGTAVPQGVA
ncbi:MAG: radical SAM protein, partial [Elusimicrobia bacterium]|nr:radical SAM protein [Elusimicrobiota bacterium]